MEMMMVKMQKSHAKYAISANDNNLVKYLTE